LLQLQLLMEYLWPGLQQQVQQCPTQPQLALLLLMALLLLPLQRQQQGPQVMWVGQAQAKPAGAN
jgi:hypothetical protein